MSLEFVYSLFIRGMVLGGALAVIPWMLGYTIASIYNLIKGG